MTVTLKDHWDQIKSRCYNNSPSAVTQLDAIWEGLANLDRANSGSVYIQPLADEVVHLVWNLHGCPEIEHDWPVPSEPPPEADPEDVEEADEAGVMRTVKRNKRK